MTRKARVLPLVAGVLAAAALAGEPPEAPPVKVCVVEPKATTKVVYASRCKDYCLPCCSLWDLLCGRRGSCDGGCGPVRTKAVLVKKKVPDCDARQCVVIKVVPAACESTGVAPDAKATPKQPPSAEPPPGGKAQAK